MIKGSMPRSSTTFPPKWKAGKTTVIRVPETMADQLLEIAHRWDNSTDISITEDRDQLTLQFIDDSDLDSGRPINVAQVPQRSPFRYPGGKTWCVPYIRAWLRSRKPAPARMIEPFAGGAIVALTVGFERLARHVVFAELDLGVSAVWRVVLNGRADWLAQKIREFDLT